MLISINGSFVDEAHPSLTFHPDLLRGYGVFETLRTFGDRKFFRIKDHLERLFHSADQIGLELQFSPKKIERMLEELVQRSPHKEQRVKIIALTDQLIILSSQIKQDQSIYQGVKSISVICERYLPEVKSISFLPSLLSNRKAKEAGCFEAILTNSLGEVFEGAYSSLFWFEADKLCTRKGKVLPGITRKVILEISPFEIQFKKINIKQLYQANEVFISSSIQRIVPVVEINGRQINNGKLGKKTKKLMEILSDLT